MKVKILDPEIGGYVEIKSSKHVRISFGKTNIDINQIGTNLDIRKTSRTGNDILQITPRASNCIYLK